MTKCDRCSGEPLPGCDGRGFIVVDTERNLTRECPKLYIQRLADYLGPTFRKIQHVKNSPLYQLGKAPGDPIVRDCTQENLIIRGSKWGSLLAHLKWALICKGMTFRHLVVSDKRLMDVYVGNESYKAKAGARREEASHNSLGDLVGKDWNLVIIRLGQFGHTNRAAPGVLREALITRANLEMPTWIVDDPEYPWDISRDSNVEAYVHKHFTDLTLEHADPGVEVSAPVYTYDDEDEESIRKTLYSSNERNECSEDMLGVAGGGKSKWKKSRNSGGPV